MIMRKHAQQPCMELKDYGAERLMVKPPKSKHQRLAVRDATVNLRGAKGESSTFTSCKYNL